MFNLTPFRKRGSLLNLDDFFNDDFFNDSFFAPMRSSSSHPLRADIKETEQEYVVEMDVPGVEKKDLEIDYVNNNLVVHGKRAYENEEKEDQYIRRERSFGEFKRAFYVDNVDENKIDASFKDGVLKITLPKLEKEVPKSRRIDVH